ncbi:SMC-Scp complex subunit ScpB [Erysipelothrix urinaevulpis]|uniref:SMC-Scp complex subunit ScpB n=1 Tax=Erysipelothrix urinaevulpis TaxID=2683717 RepID=UPI00135B2377|nr:SMC-Scp complex subunit ScpB [Erysipelothrix urinaevulpis]
MKSIAKLEGLLFAFGDEGLDAEQITKALDLNNESFEQLILDYQQHLKADDRGLKLVDYGEVYKLVTKHELHDLIAEMIEFNKTRNLSQAALETLAIIAYKQPITRLEIEDIRGVNSDMMCRRLEAMDLIKETGRAETVGRPKLYEVTPSFMDVFKLTTLKELPEIKLEMMDEKHDLFE